MDLFDALKIFSMVATGAFGTLGILTDYKDKSTGKITKWGKVAILGIGLSLGFSLFLYGMESAKAEAKASEAKRQYDETQAKLEKSLASASKLIALQGKSLKEARSLKDGLQSTLDSQRTIYSLSKEMLRKQAATLDSQRKILVAEDNLRLWQLRGYFPLEPLTVYFERELSMDDSIFTSYLARIRESVVAKYGEALLSNQNIGVNLTSGSEDWKPRKSDEFDAYHKLLLDLTWFTFSKSDGTMISFMCTPSSLEGVLVSRPAKGVPRETIDLVANFATRTITQKVACENLARGGNDLAALSSIDLIGRQLEWETKSGRITKLALAFPYDYQAPLEARYTAIEEGQSTMIVTADQIGLAPVLKETSVPR